MGKILLVLASYLILAALTIVPMIRQKKKKQIAVYLVFLTAAAVLSLLLVLGVKMSSFEGAIIKLFSSTTSGS